MGPLPASYAPAARHRGPGRPALLGRPDNERLDAQHHPGTDPDQGHSCEAPEWPGGVMSTRIAINILKKRKISKCSKEMSRQRAPISTFVFFPPPTTVLGDPQPRGPRSCWFPLFSPHRVLTPPPARKTTLFKPRSPPPASSENANSAPRICMSSAWPFFLSAPIPYP